jgi:hypothetical protein
MSLSPPAAAGLPAQEVAADTTLLRRGTRLSRPSLVLASGVAAFTFVALVDPNEPGHYPTCPFLALTGHSCFGCGSLRAMNALAHGDVAAAAGLNVLAVLSLPVLGFIWLRWAKRSWVGRPRVWAAPAWWIYGLLLSVVAFGVVRNLPVGAALAP